MVLRMRKLLAAIALAAAAVMVLVPAMAPAVALAASDDQGNGARGNGGGSGNGGDNGGSGFLNRQDFNVFGKANRDLLNTGLGHWLARLLVRLMVIGFDVALVIGIAILFWKLVNVLVGKKSKDDATKYLTDMAIAVVGIILILTGVGATVLNYLIQGAEEIQKEAEKTGMASPPAATVFLDTEGGLNA